MAFELKIQLPHATCESGTMCNNAFLYFDDVENFTVTGKETIENGKEMILDFDTPKGHTMWNLDEIAFLMKDGHTVEVFKSPQWIARGLRKFEPPQERDK